MRIENSAHFTVIIQASSNIVSRLHILKRKPRKRRQQRPLHQTVPRVGAIVTKKPQPRIPSLRFIESKPSTLKSRLL